MKSFKDINKKETDLEEACWVGYKKVGMKKKGNRMVPNCVKEELVHAVFGKDYIDREPVMEGGVEDFYKGKLNKDQLNTIKNTWKNKKQTDVTQGVKDMIRGYDIFTRMDIKKANIKYLSALINDEVQHEEVDFISPLQDQIEIIEMNSVVRKVDIEEAYFSADQLERLAKAYNVMKDKTISLANAKKLGKMVDGIPAGALNDLRKKKIPFISGLALSRMIKLKVPVTEGLDKEDEKSVDDVVKQLKKAVKAHQGQVKTLTKDLKDEKDLEEDVASDAKLVEKKRKLISANSDFVDLLLKKQDLVHDKKQLGGTNSKTFKLSSDIKKVEQEIKTSQVKLMRLTEDIEDLEEADLSKSQVTKVHKQADDLPKKDFMKRYGKDGDAVRYATATNMVKKKLGIGEDNKLITKGELKMNESYKLRLNSAMDHYKIESLGDLKDEDQKAFFDYVDGLTEGLTAGQKKLPAGLQKAILAKQGKKETADKDEMHDMKKDDKKEIKEEDAYDGTPAEVAKMKAKEKADAEKSKNEMMEKMSSEMKELKAETDPKKMEMMKKDMKKEMMNAMKDMPEMAEMSETMKNEMMNEMKKKMDEYGNMNAMKDEVTEMKEPMSAMKMNAMKMPIRSMMKKKSEDLVGGQKKLDKDKDGDLDAKDFAALRKTKSEAMGDKEHMKALLALKLSDPGAYNKLGAYAKDPKGYHAKVLAKFKKNDPVNYKKLHGEFQGESVKTGEADLEPKTKELNAMVKSSHKPDHKGNPVDDMNATYMKSNVKAAVKDNGGADMAVVKDAPKMVAAMAKISNEKKMMNMKAMYGESRENAKRYLDTKPGSLEEAVLKARGLVK